MVKTRAEIVDELADREAIRDCFQRYARATDRVDPALLETIFWPDAEVSYKGVYEGPVSGYIAMAPATRDAMEQTAHLLGNMLIEIDHAQARTESYVFAFHRLSGPDGPHDMLLGGRYLDLFERRGEEWRIARRTLVVDWFRNFGDSACWAAGLLGLQMTRGERGPSDPSHAWLARGV
jgi:hypothetical protein